METTPPPNPDKVRSMLEACRLGHLHVIQETIQLDPAYVYEQDVETGRSPLMAAAEVGNGALCQYLLEAGAPWNALDRWGQCAGDYATQHEHWAVVNTLVEWGTRSELILGLVERANRQPTGRLEQQQPMPSGKNSDSKPAAATALAKVKHESSTQPDYLRQRLHYNADGTALLDADNDAVMMEWERPLMRAHAQILMEGGELRQQQQGRRVLNVGFGLGIIDSVLQEYQPSLHIIIEAHPDVHQRMLADGWDQKQNVRICFGKWQDILPMLMEEQVEVDSIFYDTYGEHYLDFEDFHTSMVHILSKPHGRYSFFNGLAPDNLFFHGVACQCVKLQLGQLGLDTEFLPCEIQVQDAVWEGIRRKYWHGRDTYYLPRSTWNPHFLATGTVNSEPIVEEVRRKQSLAVERNGADDCKRLKN